MQGGQLARRLERKGRAKVKVKGTATDNAGVAADDKVKVRLCD
jgi:hypothetical protein